MRRPRGTVYRRKQSNYWYVAFWKNGKRVVRATKFGPEERKQAEDYLETLRGDVKRGIRPDADKVILAECERLLVANLESKGCVSVDRAKRAFWHLKQHYGSTPILELTPTLDEYTAIRQKVAKPATVRQEIRWLARGIRLAAQKGLLPYVPALPSVEVRNARQGFVSPEQLEALVLELPVYMRGPTRFAFATGWRKSEIFSLEWRSVDLENGIARVEASKSKTGHAREFPIGAMPELLSIIREAAQGRISPWVFHRDGRRISYFYDDWRDACKRAGLEGVIFHDLRRSAIRQMELAGVPRSTAMRLSGHRTEAMYTRYAISAPADLTAGVQKIVALRAAKAEKARTA